MGHVWHELEVYTLSVAIQNFRAVGSPPGVGRLIDQSGDAAEGSDIEARSAEKNFRLHFQLSGWALVALS